MAKRKQISITNDKVENALYKSDNASKLIERAILYYLDAIENEHISKERIESMVIDCIKNSNYTQEINKLVEDINFLIKEQKNKP